MPLVMLKSDPRARLKPCLRCGYSLRNVPDARNCPECWLPIWISLSGNDDLELSNPEWLKRQTLAVLVLAAGHFLLLGGAVFAWAWALELLRPLVQYATILRWLPFFAAAVVAVCGLGLLIMSADEGRVPDRARGLRRTARVVAWIALLLTAGTMALSVRPGGVVTQPWFLILIVLHAQWLACWAWLRQLARRIPSRRVRQIASSLNIALLLSLAWTIFNSSFAMFLILLQPWNRLVLPWSAFLLLYPLVAGTALLYIAFRLRAPSDAAAKNWATEADGISTA